MTTTDPTPDAVRTDRRVVDGAVLVDGDVRAVHLTDPDGQHLEIHRRAGGEWTSVAEEAASEDH
ncbi:hypothetical protein [Brachybacterium muris]|uniref:hypothetical protein n=1 Tax=Brachybacterium muris TaxID=219301 RepID=UPI00223ACE9F|nr:hypothetical protein [Brachybacterium muris]MCT1655582.1 hypothetical protein [Brachybacterium muris]